MDDRFITKIKAEIDHLRAMLEPLETGKIRIGEIGEHGQMNDRTQAQIASIQRMIDTLQAVLERDEAMGSEEN
jgi:hypothetical protein